MHDAPDLEALGAYIRAQRQSLGLSQAACAARVGWTQERISALETGRYGLPTIPTLVQLAGGLHLTLAALITAAGFDLDGPADSKGGTDFTADVGLIEEGTGTAEPVCLRGAEPTQSDPGPTPAPEAGRCGRVSIVPARSPPGSGPRADRGAASARMGSKRPRHDCAR